MLSAFTNSLKIPELRQKIFFTLALIFIARVGANIPLPGMNIGPIEDYFAAQGGAGGVVGMFNMFTGGALLKGAVFALGIMPYISASIIMQLVGAVFPAIARLQQEGDVGRQKINQYTRYLTLGICVVQGMLLLVALSTNPGSLIGPGFTTAQYGSVVIASQVPFLITGTIFLTAGTMIMVWLGEQITQKGIGNGISLLITISIISGLPSAVISVYRMVVAPVGSGGATINAPEGLLMLALLFAVTAGLVAITQAQRKIPVQYAKRVVGRKVYGGQSSFLPLKVNYAGVMPVIFGSAILMFPAQILSYLGSATKMRFFSDLADSIGPGQLAYYVVFGLLILVFSYFWVSMMFKPIQIADDLKKNGGYIPGVRPGEPTAKFLDHIMTRLTLFGAISLTVIALFPHMLSRVFVRDLPYSVAIFFGGTGMLITVGVLLDTMRQIETYLLQRHYDGFLKKGKIRGRSSARTKQMVDTAGLQDFWTAWRPLLFVAAALFLLGVLSWFLNLG